MGWTVDALWAAPRVSLGFPHIWSDRRRSRFRGSAFHRRCCLPAYQMWVLNLRRNALSGLQNGRRGPSRRFSGERGGTGIAENPGNRRSDALLRSRTGEGVPPSVNYKLEMRQKSGCRPEMSNRDSFWGAKPERGETTLIGINILGQLLTSLRDELRRQKGYTGKTVTRYLTGVKTNTLVRNGKPVS